MPVICNGGNGEKLKVVYRYLISGGSYHTPNYFQFQTRRFVIKVN